MNGLTQAELEDQRFCFAGENKINIQTNAFGFLGKGWRNLARLRLHATRFSVNAASVPSASARVANTRLYDAVQSELSMMVPTSIQQQTGVSSALHLLIVDFSVFAPRVPDKRWGYFTLPAFASPVVNGGKRVK